MEALPIKDISILERVQRRAALPTKLDYVVQLDLLPLIYQYKLSDLLLFIKSYK